VDIVLRWDIVSSAARGETKMEMTKGRLEAKLKWTSSKGHGRLTNKKLEINLSLAARTIVESHRMEVDLINRASCFATSCKSFEMLHS
jgi:hypothetical protein